MKARVRTSLRTPFEMGDGECKNFQQGDGACSWVRGVVDLRSRVFTSHLDVATWTNIFMITHIIQEENHTVRLSVPLSS